MHKGNEEEEEEGSLTHSPRAKARRGRGKEGKQPRIALSFLLASYVQRRRRRRAPSSGGINLSPFCLPPPVMAPPRYHNIHQSDRPTAEKGREGEGEGMPLNICLAEQQPRKKKRRRKWNFPTAIGQYIAWREPTFLHQPRTNNLPGQRWRGSCPLLLLPKMVWPVRSHR